MMEKPIKTIPGFQSEYSITESGRVYSHKAKRFLKPRYNKRSGYFQASLCTNGKVRYPYIHKLVALAYLTNPENKPQVNHIDGNKSNNHVSNLEYVTAKENAQHAYRTGLLDGTACKNPVSGYAHKSSRPVVMASESGHIKITYPSMTEAARETGTDFSSLHGAAHGKFKKAGGWCWSFA